MFKIDKFTWEKINSDELKIVEPLVTETYEFKTSDKDEEIENIQANHEEIYKHIEAERFYMLKKAEAESEAIKNSARAEGIAQGLEIAKEKFDELNKKQITELDSILKEFDRLKEKMQEDCTEKSLKLAMVIAEKIIDHKLKTDDGIFIDIAKKAIENMDNDEKITMKVNAHDYENYFKKEFATIKKQLQFDNILVTRDVEEGGLILESNKEYINAGINAQLNMIENSLHKEEI